MTEAEREAYIRRIVDAAPALSAEDADRVRRLIPLQSRLAAAQRGKPRRTAA